MAIREERHKTVTGLVCHGSASRQHNGSTTWGRVKRIVGEVTFEAHCSAHIGEELLCITVQTANNAGTQHFLPCIPVRLVPTVPPATTAWPSRCVHAGAQRPGIRNRIADSGPAW